MRRGFTFVEILIVSALASTLLAILYSAFSFYARSITREDRNIERSRRSQEILSLLHDDCARAGGELTPADIPLAGLAAVGFSGTVTDFLTLPRRGTNIISAYSGFGTPTPYVAHPFDFLEKEEVADAAGEKITYSAGVSNYGKDGPAEALRLRIPPRAAVQSFIHVPVPWERPVADYWVIRTVLGKNPEAVLWAFHRERQGLMPPGTLIRYSSSLGTVRMTGEGLGSFDCRLMFDWTYVDPNPPRRPEPYTRLLMSLAAVSLGFDPPSPGQKTVANASAMLVVGH